jgi:hypothetical protein
VAKDQHLSLNPIQISGPCGRLLCCLHYEHDFYVQSRRRFPKEGKILKTEIGQEKVLAIDIFRDRVTLRSEEQGTRVVELAALELEVQRAGGEPVVTTAAPPTPPAPAPPPASPPSPSVTTSAAPATGGERQGARRRRRRGRGPRNGGGEPPAGA